MNCLKEGIVATETEHAPKSGNVSFRFLCDNQKDLDELLDCLHPQGVRESQLKERLEKRLFIVSFVFLLNVKAHHYCTKF